MFLQKQMQPSQLQAKAYNQPALKSLKSVAQQDSLSFHIPQPDFLPTQNYPQFHTYAPSNSHQQNPKDTAVFKPSYNSNFVQIQTGDSEENDSDFDCLSQRQISQKMRSPQVNISPLNQAFTNGSFFRYQMKVNHIDGSLIKISHLVLQDFKRFKCTQLSVPHNHKSCFFYHSVKDRRRDDSLYTPELCKHAETDRCPATCRRSHNRVERLYHSEKYKTKFCHMYPNKVASCEYGEYCSFAHSVEDIKVRLVHYLIPQKSKNQIFTEEDFAFYILYFKSEWCPYNHEHNKAQCFYAHNYQDFRRRPDLFDYSTQLCECWQSGTFITCYKEGCNKLEKCQNSHGWKEQQFHPLVYKTQPCVEGTPCFKGLECQFFHSLKDKRTKLTIAKPKRLSCFQQPEMESLRFSNNLNHVRESEPMLFAIKPQTAAIVKTPKPQSTYQSLFFDSKYTDSHWKDREMQKLASQIVDSD